MIFLSAGHHRSAPGAAWKGFVEHTEAVNWVDQMFRLMPGATIIPFVELSRKIAWVNARCKSSDILVEVHFNAATPTARGCETLYAPGSTKGRELATDLQLVLSQFFKPDRGIKEGWYQQDPNKGPLALLARTRCTSVIIEPEFVYWADSIRGQRNQCCAALVQALKNRRTP